jgi:2-methylcitrate dehydratase PrpD
MAESAAAGDGLVVELGEWAARVDGATLPRQVAADVAPRVLDIVGLALAALPLDTSRAALGYAADTGGAPQATAIGVAAQLPAAQAAFVNGVLAHSLDYDDTHLPSILHPSASVVPAVLAAAERHHRTGADVVAAVAVGLEVCIRLGMAGYDHDRRQSTFFEHGQHATSICGTVAGAAAAAKLAGLDGAGIASAMGVAASMASGIIEANRSGGTVKRMHCGWAAHAAVAAELVARGITGPPTALEGRFGLYAAFLHGQFDPAALTDGLGERWEQSAIHYKPYPANHFTHAIIDAGLAFRAAGLTADDIASVEIGVAAPTVRTIGEPLETKRCPETGYQAQFSGPYAFAAALAGGSGLGLGLDDFTDKLARDRGRRALMARTTVVADAECDAIYPDELPAIVRVRTTGGDDLEQRVLWNRGGPQRPLSADELATKYRDNASRVLPAAAVDAIEAAAGGLATLDDITTLLAPTSQAKEIT